MSRARRAWCERWRNSPWTGMKHSGRASDSSVLSSSRLAWPLTCTWARPEWMTSAPSRLSPSMTLPTLVSLPGMAWEERTTRSPSPTEIHLLSAAAIRARADMGSPCEPVEITQTRRGSWSPMRSMSTRSSSAMRSRPIDRARATFLAMERPSVATTRPLATAASAICWTRWIWLAKQATMIRLSGWAANRPVQHRADPALAVGVAVLLGVGGVRQQQPDPGPVGQGADLGQVGRPPVDGRQVDLEVARVQDHALRGVEGGGEPVGHRVGDGDELHIERADLAPLPVAHRDRARSGRAGRPPRSGSGPGPG